MQGILSRVAVVATIVVISSSQTRASGDASLDKPFQSSFHKLQHAPCNALFHRNGRTGCGTEDRNTQVGKLKYYDGSLPQNNNEPYVAVMEDYRLTATYMDTLVAARAGGLLQGVLVLNSTASDGSTSDEQRSYYSPDSKYPQGYGTPSQNLNYGYAQYKWNAQGQDLLSYDFFGLPMGYVYDSDVSDSIRDASQSDEPDDAIVAEFNYYMGADQMDSQTCLAWEDVASGEWSPKCLPLGGTSVWASCGSPANPNNKNPRPIVVVGAGMDATSLFHDVSPGANAAASNILTVLMAAKLIGANVDDNTLDGLSNRIVFALFQGESYGFIGSRAFLRDLRYPGFQCYGSPVHSVYALGEKSEYACLNPVRPSLAFANLGKIAGMISVDQLGHTTGDGQFYVQADQNNDNYGKFVANVLVNSGTSTHTVTASSVSNNGNGYPYPPTPLTSLLSLSGGGKGGAVLTGYDYAYTNKLPYHSIMDTVSHQGLSLKDIAAAATILARATLAAAYDDGSYDYETSAAYAYNLIPELSYYDETLQSLANCFLYDGQCQTLQKYSGIEMANLRASTGLNLGSGQPMTTPPSYYVGVYNGYYGQPFVQVGDGIYGAYDGKDYGAKKTDAVGMIPRQIESAIHGLFNDFLGRGTLSAGDDDGSGQVGQKCEKTADCAAVGYCQSYGEAAVCTGGGMCVCQRAHYHVALDEALYPVPEKPTGFFKVKDNDGGYSPIYTEPFWSSNVGVGVYRDVGWEPGFFTLVAGLLSGAVSLFSAFVLRVGLKKEKLY